MSTQKFVPIEDGNAIVEALGAILMAVGRELPKAAQEAIALNLQRISGEAERTGKHRTAMLISDLSLAAETQWRQAPNRPI